MRAFAVLGIFAASLGIARLLSAQASSSSSLPPAQAGSPKENVNLNDPTGIAIASYTGDQDKLGMVASVPADGADVIAKALRERSLYQLDLSSKTAAACGEVSKIGNSSANMQCAFVLAGNKLLVNDIAGWAKTMQALKTLAYPKLVQQVGKLLHKDPATLKIGEFEVSPDYAPFFSVPPVSVSRHAEAFDVPLQQQAMSTDGRLTVYAVTPSINGHPLQIVFDTGAPMTLIDADDARKLQVDTIYPNFMLLSDGSWSSLGIVKRFQLGDVEISNLPVVVSSKPMKFPALGLNAIQYLGAFRIHADTLHSVAGGFEACATPMDVATTINGTGQNLLAHGTVDGKPFPFLVATGIPDTISRSHYGPPSASVSATPYQVMTQSGTEYAYVSTDHASMQIGDAPLADSQYQVVYHAGHTRFRYYLGAGYIRQHDLTVDFTRGMMCLK
jgi:gag-polyprotein putative aspartyl protease